MNNTSILNKARNALLSAGHDLGADGAHWDVIKPALASLTRSYQALKLEQEIAERLRVHMSEALDNYEELLNTYSEIDPELAAELRTFVAELRTLYAERYPGADDEKAFLGELGLLANDIEGMLPPDQVSALLRDREN